MQIITIAGRIGRDAETRTVNDNTVTGFTVAVDQHNGRDKTTNWWRVSLWGKRGERLAQYLTKGASVTVSGDFSLSEYEGKPQLNIRASEIALQGGKSDAPRNEAPRQQAAPPADDLDDEIPF